VPKLTNDVIEQLESERQHLAELEEAQLISDRKQLSFYTGEQTVSCLNSFLFVRSLSLLETCWLIGAVFACLL